MTDAPRNYAASHPVVRISAKRFQASPWQRFYADPATVFGVYSGRFYPLSLGTDPIDDYWHLRQKVALFDVPEHPIQIEGPDAERFLDHLLTRDMRTVPPGRARYALAVDHEGHILMDGVLIRWTDDRFWYVMADGDFLGWIRAQAAAYNVTVSDPGSWVLQVQGPRSLAMLADACDGGAPDPLPYFGAAPAHIAGQAVLVTRTGWTGELGFEVYTLPGTDPEALWRGLLAAGEQHDLRVASLECMGIRRIEAGILDNGTDMDPSMTPYQAGLGKFVDLDKPSFIGRGALLDAPRDCLLFGVAGPGTPVPHAQVRQAGTRVGRVRAGAWSPSLSTGLGYVQFDAPGDWVGSTVTIDGCDGEATVCALPFLDAERLIPRGLADEPVRPA